MFSSKVRYDESIVNKLEWKVSLKLVDYVCIIIAINFNIKIWLNIKLINKKFKI